MKQTPYETLGVDVTATDEEIKSAYRKKSKETYPDMKNGSTEEFQEVNTAYMILSSPERRKKFDETGETENETPFEKKFRALVQEIFVTMIESTQDINSTDLIEGFKDNVHIIQMDLGQRMHEAQQKMDKMQKVRDRVKGGEVNMIAMILDNNIAEQKRVISMNRDNIKFMDKVLEELKNYTYDVDNSEFKRRFLISRGLMRDEESDQEQTNDYKQYTGRKSRDGY